MLNPGAFETQLFSMTKQKTFAQLSVLDSGRRRQAWSAAARIAQRVVAFPMKLRKSSNKSNKSRCKKGMNTKHLLYPMPSLLAQSDDNLYSANKYGPLESRVSQTVMTVIALMAIVLAVTGMFKAFSCGSMATNFGLTGTGWGVIILVLALYNSPTGGLLGLAFMIGGSCGGSCSSSRF